MKNKKTYLAKWPNGTVSILTADNDYDCFDKLDVEPFDAKVKIYSLPEVFHLTTNIKTKGKGNQRRVRSHPFLLQLDS